MPFNFQSSVRVTALACVFPCGAVGAQERPNESQPATDAVKNWYAFYHHEAAHAYRFQLEPGDVELELDPTPILRWTNPLEEGSIHGVVYVWRHQGRPVVIGQLFSYLNGKGGRVYCHAMLVVGNDPEVIVFVEKGEKPAGGPVWKFGLVLSTRSTSVALLDEREVWRYDSSGKNPNDPRGGYLSVHGIATLPLEPPERAADKP